MSLISATGLTVKYGTQKVLNKIDMSVAPGEIVTIVGPNGSGKTTLLRALLGLTPAKGKVQKKPGLVIGYVPQKLALDPTLPLPVRSFLNLPRSHTPQQIAEMLDRVGVPGIETRQVADLSGGQLQRVLLARALLERPDILILDEPTQGLDQMGEAGFYRLIEDVRQASGVAVLMVSHDLHVVMSASDRVICLNGHVCCEGKPHVVQNAPEYRALFGYGTQGALALYQHAHDHNHDHGCDHDHDHVHNAVTRKDDIEHAG
ncbi:zinc transport system ATP-binding protein [Aliiroseovarius halocynthiae]|uniref:Metal ABC transporter ATP-binding protein n=1 Tax=Aliiroseovarius halocynthiae TaxID=985055 RepID=A0A545SSN4_9RHOB|nr:metal ABC transporter ATP-binding protein [Aliiroseovarius halocynthiae]TQV67945.1 metal ABC transporter ATP-binding protein [Aliiroseovarius halocynthiae]SMR73047.1 zinc transport system ATP-binding protein [Aliiroseovarius halocynthiae]